MSYVTEYGIHNQGLFELDPPTPGWAAKHGEPNLDVVAVHGLNGECFRSWTHEETTGEQTLWLKDLLLQRLPRTRVMTFGYDASVVGNTSVAGIRDNARKLLVFLRNKREDDGTRHRPIVFVGHSLGGIIIKQALRIARNEPELAHVADSTKGIVFFGTPHRGTDVASWGELVAGIKAASFGTRPRTTFFRLLRTNSDDLMDLSEDFRPIAQSYALVSFVEENTMGKLGFNRVVVARHSAVMELPHEERMLINGDHSTMCKFSRDPAQAGRFDPVWRSIQRAAKGPGMPTATTTVTGMAPTLSMFDVYQLAQAHAHANANANAHGVASYVVGRPGVAMIQGPVVGTARSSWQLQSQSQPVVMP